MSARIDIEHARRIAISLLLASAVGGCGGEGNPGEPVPVLLSGEPDGGLPVDAGEDADPPDADPPVVRRTVSQRNPFGNVAETANLLWDGDFEWLSPFSSQYGWVVGPPYDFLRDGVRIGADCRSGVKCVTVAKNKSLLGIGVASDGQKLDASLWARPESGVCTDVVARLISAQFPSADPDADVPAETEVPGEDHAGWCRYSAVTDVRTEKPYFQIRNEGDGEVIVDDVVLKAVAFTKSVTLHHRAPTAADLASAAEARDALRAMRPPQDRPPTPARRALESWGARRSTTR